MKGWVKVFNLLGHFEQTSSSFASHSSLVPSWSEVSAVLIVLLSKLMFQKGLSFKNTHNLVEITDEELLHNLHYIGWHDIGFTRSKQK